MNFYAKKARFTNGSGPITKDDSAKGFEFGKAANATRQKEPDES